MNSPASAPTGSDAMRSLALAPDLIPPGWLITARSLLVDSVVPDVEHVRLPARRVGGGRLGFRLGEITAALPRPQAPLRRLAQRLRQRHRRLEDRVLIDLRRHYPDNWAHFLTNHLPLVFGLTRELGIGWDRVLLVLPRRTPGHVNAAAEIFGFPTLCTDDSLSGTGIAYTLEPWTALRSVRTDWARSDAVQGALAAAEHARPAGQALPRRVFLSRRDTRRLVNEAEIAMFLAARGYETLYPEDLAPIDQFRLLRETEKIVAIHGAGLAPLLYRPASAPPGQVLELFPCPHVTAVWRALSAQTGCAWIGVRGRLKLAHVCPAYDFKRSFKRLSLEDFEVDPHSLERALDILEGADPEAPSAAAGGAGGRQ